MIGMKKEGDNEHIYYVGEDSHLLCIGATRSGKTRNLVVQSICTLGLAGESIVVSDPKAELYDYTAEFLEKLGYRVLVLDFKTPAKSMRYNLLQPIINAVNHDDTDRAEMLAWDLTNNFVGKPEGEKSGQTANAPSLPLPSSAWCAITNAGPITRTSPMSTGLSPKW